MTVVRDKAALLAVYEHALATHLNDAERDLVHRAIALHTQRFAELFSTRHGEVTTEQEFARFTLECATRVAREKGEVQ